MRSSEFIVSTCIEKLGEYLEMTEDPNNMLIDFMAAKLWAAYDRIDQLEKVVKAYETTRCN